MIAFCWTVTIGIVGSRKERIELLQYKYSDYGEGKEEREAGEDDGGARGVSEVVRKAFIAIVVDRKH